MKVCILLLFSLSLLIPLSECGWMKSVEKSLKKGVSETENIAKGAVDGMKTGFKKVENFFLDGTSAANDFVKDFNIKSHYCECKGHACQCCATIVDNHFGLNDTVCVDASYDTSSLGVSADITWDGKIIISETLSASNPPPICEFVPIPKLKKLLQVCFRLHDVEISRTSFRACFSIGFTVVFAPVYRFELGCVEFGSKDWNWVCGYSHQETSTSEDKRHSCVCMCDGFLHYKNSTSLISADESSGEEFKPTEKRYTKGQCEFKTSWQDPKQLCVLGCTPSSYDVEVF